jgi:3-oxoacyl-[acyl-carrier protein] reductase
MSSPLDGKIAIATGSSSGIGLAIARRLAAEGANVVANSRSRERTVAAVDEIDGGAVLPVEADVTDYDSLRSLVERTVQKFGSVDVWVNNAGINIRGPAEQISLDDWQTVIDVNLTGTFYGALVRRSRRPR